MPPSEAISAAKFLGMRATNEADVIEKLREGFPTGAIRRVETQLDLSHATLATLLDLPIRSFARRIKEPKLSRHMSEVLYRIARIYQRAVATLDDDEKAVRWLQKPNRSLGNVVPFDILDTEVGARQVEDALGRIAYGVYG